ncbi:unnamed protein product [Allacma fusca]|uniref:Uncharacterized protein n=1 Tax=Allacma fusca TaxID=39272 RepID=A0A8J2JMT8_9HEXA|nr:unnamed protein product [Allacma fusca]
MEDTGRMCELWDPLRTFILDDTKKLWLTSSPEFIMAEKSPQKLLTVETYVDFTKKMELGSVLLPFDTEWLYHTDKINLRRQEAMLYCF